MEKFLKKLRSGTTARANKLSRLFDDRYTGGYNIALGYEAIATGTGYNVVIGYHTFATNGQPYVSYTLDGMTM